MMVVPPRVVPLVGRAARGPAVAGARAQPLQQQQVDRRVVVVTVRAKTLCERIRVVIPHSRPTTNYSTSFDFLMTHFYRTLCNVIDL